MVDSSTHTKLRMSITLVVCWYALIYPLYNWVGILSITFSSPFVPLTSFDSLIPFIPAFVYAYVLMFFLPALTLFFSFHPKISLAEIKSFYYAQIALLLTCYAFYLVLPSSAESIQVDLSAYTSSLTTSLITFLYDWGVPYNAFPSYHVAPLVLTALFVHAKSARLFWWSLPLIISPIMATVFIKYHFIADILGGVVFGTIFYLLLAKYPLPRTLSKKLKLD